MTLYNIYCKREGYLNTNLDPKSNSNTSVDYYTLKKYTYRIFPNRSTPPNKSTPPFSIKNQPADDRSNSVVTQKITKQIKL